VEKGEKERRKRRSGKKGLSELLLDLTVKFGDSSELGFLAVAPLLLQLLLLLVLSPTQHLFSLQGNRQVDEEWRRRGVVTQGWRNSASSKQQISFVNKQNFLEKK
jgi:hypothetical protein